MSEFFIQVQDGRIANRKWEGHLKSLPDGNYLIKIEKSNKRSTAQNRFYWGIVIPMVKTSFIELGHEVTAEETHEFLKSKFNAIQVSNKDTGEMIDLPRSTTRLSKMDFCEYVEKIQRFAATFLGIVIPDPSEQLKFEI